VADPTDPEHEGLAVIGWLDATGYYAPTPLQITPRLYLATPDYQAADCVAAASNMCYPEFAGVVVFGGAPNAGFDPCFTIVDNVEPTTWSRLKRFGTN